MTDERRKQLGIPKLDFSGLRKSMSEEEIDAICEKIESTSRQNLLAFVDRLEKHPEALTAWDIPIPFDEFARRVRAGERI